MKRLLLFVALALMAASCEVGGVDEAPLTLFAALEAPSEAESQTKVYADSQLQILWNADDRISVFYKDDSNFQFRFDGNDGDNNGPFVQVGCNSAGNALPNIYAIYPYSSSITINAAEAISLTLPAIQYYRKNSFGTGSNTMVSVTEDNLLQFKNVGGYLSVKLYGAGISVKNITLRGNNHEKLAGAAAVTMLVGGTPMVVMQKTATESVMLTCPTPVALEADEDKFVEFWFALPPTEFSQGFTVSVTDASGGVFKRSTRKAVSITRNSISRMAPVEVTTVQVVPEAVDLGLPSGLKWASFNIGATCPEEYGDYFAWGETETKAFYDWSNYKWCDGTRQSLNKYNVHKSLGTIDNKWILEPDDDVAHVKWGGSWRMPAWWERSELMDECDWIWTTRNGVKGYEIKSRTNGNSIFLPAAGSTAGENVETSGLYWAGNMWTGNSASGSIICFDSEGAYDYYICYRQEGLPVRPVSDEGVRVSVTGMELSIDKITIVEGDSREIIATVSPSYATQPTVIWSSSNASVATVSCEGMVKAISTGEATITAITYDGGYSATCEVTVTPGSGTENGHGWVDLGLPSGTRWATVNIGAVSPEEYGDYFAVGETEPKSSYDWSSYKWCEGTSTTLMKYNSNPDHGIVDGKTSLDPEDDAAHAKWGGLWRMPTGEQMKELIDNCTWEWTQENGVDGFRVTGKASRSIFLPGAGYKDESSLSEEGYGEYLSSSISTTARLLFFEASGRVMANVGWHCCGYTVRPVLGKEVRAGGTGNEGISYVNW